VPGGLCRPRCHHNHHRPDRQAHAARAGVDGRDAAVIDIAQDLLLVGDVDQLPPAGVGEVLRDLISAGTLPVVRLAKSFRQAQQSGIVAGAHKVNAGRSPALTGYPDFFWFNSDETEATATLVADIVARRIPARFGLDPRRDVQVLCPCRGDDDFGWREGQPRRPPNSMTWRSSELAARR
jgi:hypothetical protein